MKVLIIKLSSIGDCIHTLPAVASLREGFEKKGIKARIDWLVEEAASSVLARSRLIDNVIVVKRGWLKNFSENRRVARALAATRYDLVLDFQGLLKSGVWVYLSKGARRAGFSNGREMSHLFLNDRLPAYDPERHAVDRYLDLAVHAGGASGPARFQVDTGKAAKSAERKLREAGVGKEPFFVIVSRARWATKLWGEERFARLARHLCKETGFKAVLAGGAEDRASLEAMKEEIGFGAVNLAGRTDLSELAEVFRRARFAVTVDSGPMHLAAAVGTRCVAIFGPTAPWRTGPYGSRHIVVRKGLECSPCFSRKCAEPKCMTSITVDDVLEAMKPLLAEGGDRSNDSY
ncbi:MAG: lipopolysaccharide heptosyltransferase I [Thermodesulfobacteriota bacterium]|nr:MAG: lipopolysaccharide heptosyltransferase I [Thermodesulfobacteriota bacterium]